MSHLVANATRVPAGFVAVAIDPRAKLYTRADARTFDNAYDALDAAKAFVAASDAREVAQATQAADAHIARSIARREAQAAQRATPHAPTQTPYEIATRVTRKLFTVTVRRMATGAE